MLLRPLWFMEECVSGYEGKQHPHSQSEPANDKPAAIETRHSDHAQDRSEDRESDRKIQSSIARSTKWMMIFTGVLVFTTIVGSYFQWRAVREATRAARAAVEQAQIAREALADAKASGEETIKTAREQARNSRLSADAARHAVDVASRSLQLSQRAWLSLVPQIGPPNIQVGKDSTLAPFFKNTGRLPASKATARWGFTVGSPCSQDGFEAVKGTTSVASIAPDALSRAGLTLKLTVSENAVLRRDPSTLCVYITLTYTDPLGSKGLTRFCLRPLSNPGGDAANPVNWDLCGIPDVMN